MEALTDEQYAFLAVSVVGYWDLIDGKIYVKGSFYHLNFTGTKLPVKFSKVTENFTIRESPNLITLDGCPDEVDGIFDCSGCIKLESLKGCPRKIGKEFFCTTMGNIIIDSKDLPEHVGNVFLFNYDYHHAGGKYDYENHWTDYIHLIYNYKHASSVIRDKIKIKIEEVQDDPLYTEAVLSQLNNSSRSLDPFVYNTLYNTLPKSYRSQLKNKLAVNKFKL